MLSQKSSKNRAPGSAAAWPADLKRAALSGVWTGHQQLEPHPGPGTGHWPCETTQSAAVSSHDSLVAIVKIKFLKTHLSFLQ